MTFQKLPNDRHFVASTSGNCEFVLGAIYELPKCEVNNKDQNFKRSWNEVMSHCSPDDKNVDYLVISNNSKVFRSLYCKYML